MKINKLLLPLFAAMTLALLFSCANPASPDKDDGGGDKTPPKTDTTKLIEENFIGKWADIFGGNNSFDLKAGGKCTQGTYTDEMTWTIDDVKKTITIQSVKDINVTYVYNITVNNSKVVLKDSSDTLGSTNAKATVGSVLPPADGGGDKNPPPKGDTETDFIGKWVRVNNPSYYYDLKTDGKGKSDSTDITWVFDKANKQVIITAGAKTVKCKVSIIEGKLTLKDPYGMAFRISDNDNPPADGGGNNTPKEYPPKYNAPTAKCNTYTVDKKPVKAIDISWANSSPAGNKVIATEYFLFRATNSSETGIRVYTAGKSQLTYQDKNSNYTDQKKHLIDGQTYYYYIVARSKDGDGPAGARVSVKFE